LYWSSVNDQLIKVLYKLFSAYYRVDFTKSAGRFLKDPRKDMGKIQCEVDGQFENLLMSWLEQEPERLLPILYEINTMTFLFEERVNSCDFNIIYFIKTVFLIIF
jgi:hypothetical protein